METFTASVGASEDPHAAAIGAAAQPEAAAAPAGPPSPQRPGSLDRVALVLCVANVLDVATYRDWEGSLASFLLLYGFAAALSFFVIWHFWRGQNWARWTLLGTSVATLLFVPNLTFSELISAGIGIAEALLAVWLLWWLRRPRVACYFRSVPPWPSVPPAVKWTFVGLGCSLLLAFGGVAVLAMLEPTPHPVFDERISEKHRLALQSVHPAAERVLGLYSLGTLRVEEFGCLFTERRIVVYVDGVTAWESSFDELADARPGVETGVFDIRELKIRKTDGTVFSCPLPSASASPDGAAAFLAHLTRALKQYVPSRKTIDPGTRL